MDAALPHTQISSLIMFSVVPLIPRYDNPVHSSRTTKQRHHPDVQRDINMELDEMEDDEDSQSRITSPGEAIASSSAVLRYVPYEN
jgi:hypothetical protein